MNTCGIAGAIDARPARHPDATIDEETAWNSAPTHPF
jgi:hypothetical protein